MVADRRAGHLRQGGDVDDALLRMEQQPEDPDPAGIVQQAEHLRSRSKAVLRGQKVKKQLCPSAVSVVVGQNPVVHAPASFAVLRLRL